jgi:hypothetical protein
MRKIILIAGFVLASATAHGADRSLSLPGAEKQSAPAPAKTIDVPRTAEAPQAAETPKYTERPAIVEPKPEAQRTETPRAETSRGEASSADSPRAGRYRAGRYRPAARVEQNMAERPRAEGGRPMMRRTASMSRRGMMRPHRPFRLARIIHALHRYGIYW